MEPELTITREGFGHSDVELKGELTVRYAANLLNIFNRLAALNTNVRIVIRDLEGADLCFLQLMWSFIRYSQSNGKTTTVSTSCKEEDQRLMQRTGFHSLLNYNTSQLS